MENQGTNSNVRKARLQGSKASGRIGIGVIEHKKIGAVIGHSAPQACPAIQYVHFIDLDFLIFQKNIYSPFKYPSKSKHRNKVLNNLLLFCNEFEK